MNRDCEHGQLARSCNICDLERELKAVTEQCDKLLAALESWTPLEHAAIAGKPCSCGQCEFHRTRAAAIAEAKGQS